MLRHPDRFAFLQRVERTDPALPTVLQQLGATPGCRSIRMNVRGRVERASLAEGGHDLAFGLAQQYGLAISLLGNRVTAALERVLPRFPQARFMLDHCGQPETAQEWDDILALGRRHPNLWLKWAHGRHFFASGGYPYAGVQRQLLRALDAFGSARVVWASDYTHDRTGASWADLLFCLRDSAELSDGDKAWLFARAARALYAWPAPEKSFAPPHWALLPGPWPGTPIADPLTP